MKTLLPLCLALLLAAPSFAASRCDHWPAEGAGPTTAQVKDCWTGDLSDVIAAEAGSSGTQDLETCLAGGQSVTSRLTKQGLELKCNFFSLTWKKLIPAARLQDSDMKVLPVGLSMYSEATLIRASAAKDLDSLKGEALMQAFESAQLDDKMIDAAVGMFERGIRRKVQAQRLERFFQQQP